jgi:hypothetical protein
LRSSASLLPGGGAPHSSNQAWRTASMCSWSSSGSCTALQAKRVQQLARKVTNQHDGPFTVQHVLLVKQQPLHSPAGMDFTAWQAQLDLQKHSGMEAQVTLVKLLVAGCRVKPAAILLKCFNSTVGKPFCCWLSRGNRPPR